MFIAYSVATLLLAASSVSGVLLAIPAMPILGIVTYAVCSVNAIVKKGQDSDSILASNMRVSENVTALSFILFGVASRLIAAFLLVWWFGYMGTKPSIYFLGIFYVTALLPSPKVTIKNNIGSTIGLLIGTHYMINIVETHLGLS